MECAKFEEQGLLYVAGELSAEESGEYEAHLKVCDECKREVDLHRNESASLFTAETLGEEPSASVSAEILRVCADPKKMRQPALMPMIFLKKYASVSFFIMLVAVAIGGYVRYHQRNADGLQNKWAPTVVDADLDTAELLRDVAYPDFQDMAAIEDSVAAGDSVRQTPLGKSDAIRPVSEQR